LAKEEVCKTDLGRRLRDVRRQIGDPPRAEFAKRLGIAEKSLGNYERGDRVPDADVLGAYRTMFAVDVSWLVTGLGEMFADPSKMPASARLVDLDLHERLGAIIDQEHRAARINMQMEVFAAEVGKAYNHLVGLVADLSDAEAVGEALPLVRRRVRQQLADAASNPGTGKREAS